VVVVRVYPNLLSLEFVDNVVAWFDGAVRGNFVIVSCDGWSDGWIDYGGGITALCNYNQPTKLSDSMEQSPSLEANIHSACQEIPRLS